MKKPLFELPYYLTDGGLETTLVFHRGIPLSCFAAFDLLRNDEGRKELRNYYLSYLKIAARYRLPFVMESPTWRASADWGFRLGYTHDELFAINKKAIKFMRDVAEPYADRLPEIIVSGNIGPRGDGYRVDTWMSAQEAKAYHLDQVKAFALADADLVSAFTINYCEEAIGIVEAAKSFNLPVVISFTVETDGHLPSGDSIGYAIEKVDAETGGYAEHYMINCAHPEHFKNRLIADAAWVDRIKGIRANASMSSHAELDASETLDTGDKTLLLKGYQILTELLPNLKVVGGCCGTDHTHISHICRHLKKDVNAR